MYIAHVENNFDLEAIRTCGLNWAYDAMYGAGQNVMRHLFSGYYFFCIAMLTPVFDGAGTRAYTA